MTGKRGGQKGPRGEYEQPLALDMDPDEAFERFVNTDPSEADAVAAAMSSTTMEDLLAAFEAAAQPNDGGEPFWFARDLQQLFKYDQWRRFAEVIDRAKSACEQAGQSVENHFAIVGKMVPIGSGATREIEDIALSRYAAYLTAQNADPRKTPVAFAQTYFATQTRRQELADEAARELSYDEKRVLLRSKLKEHNKSLAEAAKTAGVKNFANFNGSGLKGLYGGLNKAQVVKRKGLPTGADHLDYAGHEELAANYFKATQAEAKLRREIEANGEIGQRKSDAIHKSVGEAVRKTITDLGNTPPEAIAAEDHIREAQKRVKAANPAPSLPKPAKKT